MGGRGGGGGGGGGGATGFLFSRRKGGTIGLAKQAVEFPQVLASV